jgi:hypothetical protein
MNPRAREDHIRRACDAAWALVFALTPAAVFVPADAHAYSFASPLAPGCHEAITLTALRRVREDFPSLAPSVADASDRVWIDDLPLDLPTDARDLGAASLVVGVRDNDLKGKSALDAAELSFVHGDPDAQREHCLRGPADDEPEGTATALAACQAFIRERATDAVRAGFDSDGRPDPGNRVDVDVYLAFAGETRVPMPRAYVELGRALHALQDSFSHAVRSDNALRVRTLLNWVDVAHDHHDESRDGPAHRAALDRCEGLDAARQLRLARAEDASEALLRAVLDPAQGRDARLAQVDAVLDRYLSYEPGCDAANGFCDAPELAYAASAMGCTIGGGARDRMPGVIAVVLCGALCVRRRPRRGRLARGAHACIAPTPARRLARAALLGALLALGPIARATAQVDSGDEPHEDAHDDRTGKPGTPTSRFALSTALSASLDQAGAAAAVGGRFAASDHWHLGLNVAWSPWAALDTNRLEPGTLDGYGSLTWRAHVTRYLALRVSGRAGASVLLFDLYGAPGGSVGPCFGLSLLGLEVPLGRRVRLILEPADVAVSVPHLTGIPLVRRQYRATIGVEIAL